VNAFQGYQQSIWWEGFVEKFESGVKKWGSNRCWEWWWWQLWLDRYTRKPHQSA